MNKDNHECPWCHGTGDVYCTKSKCHEGCPIPGRSGHDKSKGGYYGVDCKCGIGGTRRDRPRCHTMIGRSQCQLEDGHDGDHISDKWMKFNQPPTALRAYPILRFFEYEHLPPRLQLTSRPFSELAYELAGRKTQHPAELAAALRKLLEAKDAAVRAALL